jgi:tRNA uracil 4-sulfurtransferase
MTDEKYILIHYSEIALKKGNRKLFEKQLRQNIGLALGDLPGHHFQFDYGRFLIQLENNAPVEAIIERLRDVIGLAHFSLAYKGATDVSVLKEQIFEKLQSESFTSFCIQTRRADKLFPLNSVQVNQIVGERIYEGLNKKVDLTTPELTCTIEIFSNKIFYHFKREPGRRGLPVGSSGKVVSLLSSGIDSPVAAYRMMTRGCKVIFVHFHSFPFTEKESYYNAIQLVKQLTRFQYRSVLYLVPLVQIQQAIIEITPPKLRLILYRRMMLRIAQNIAKNEHAKALVTGESLGQVASQTLENITAISEVTTLPILRPLIGMDKEEIIHQAKALKTFATSTEPYDDCCSYLVPANPEIKARLLDVRQIENQIHNRDQLIQESLLQAEQQIITFP